MGKGKKSKRSSKSRSKNDNVELGTGSMASKTPMPLALGLLGLEIIFGIVFIVVGSMNVDKCKIEPMVPIWLILMGIIAVITGAHEYNQYRMARKSTYNGRGLVSLIITAAVTATTVGLFIAGNVFVYRAWGEDPDYGHYWYSNGCDMGTYMLAFVGVIVLDVFFGLLVIGILIYAAYSCFCSGGK